MFVFGPDIISCPDRMYFMLIKKRLDKSCCLILLLAKRTGSYEFLKKPQGIFKKLFVHDGFIQMYAESRPDTKT
jgi:hypothetical protein